MARASEPKPTTAKRLKVYGEPPLKMLREKHRPRGFDERMEAIVETWKTCPVKN